MGCNCKDNREAITDGKKVIAELRELFIKRMTVDSDTDDRRIKDYNQAIFFWDFCEKDKTPENAMQVWDELTMDMVLKCFDNAAKDWRKSFCDVKNCTRKK